MDTYRLCKWKRETKRRQNCIFFCLQNVNVSFVYTILLWSSVPLQYTTTHLCLAKFAVLNLNNRFDWVSDILVGLFKCSFSSHWEWQWQWIMYRCKYSTPTVNLNEAILSIDSFCSKLLALENIVFRERHWN